MSFHHTNWVRQHSKVKRTAPLAILLVLASLADKDTGYCSVDDETLAKFTKMSRISVWRLIPDIPEDELRIVTKGGSPKGQKRTKTVYQVLKKEGRDPVQFEQGIGRDNIRDPVQTEQGATPPYPVQTEIDPVQVETLKEKKEKSIRESSSSSGLHTVSGSSTVSKADDDELLNSKGTKKEAPALANGNSAPAQTAHGPEAITPEKKDEPDRANEVASLLRTPEEEHLVELLTGEHVTLDVAEALVRDFEAAYIEDHIDAFKLRRKNGEKHNGGWLVLSIQKGYEFPEGFRTHAQKEEAQAALARQAAEQQHWKDEHEEEERLNDLAKAYIDKLTPEALAEIEAEANRDAPKWRTRGFFFEAEKRSIAKKRLGLVNAFSN